MPSRRPPLLPVALALALAAPTAHATTAAGRPARDTAGAPAIDSAAQEPRLAFGVGVGSLAFDDGLRERLLMAGASVRLLRGLTLAVHPGFVSVSELAAQTASDELGRTGWRRRSQAPRSPAAAGFLDLPVVLAAEHEFERLPLSPSVSAGYSVLAPTRSAQLGGGEAAGSLDLGLGVSPTERVNVGAGVGRYQAGSAWALRRGPAATWGDATVSVDVARALSLSVGGGTSLGRAEQAADASGVESGRTVDGAATLRLRGLPPLTLDARHAYDRTAPRWSIGLAVGRVGLPLTTLGRLGVTR